VELQHVDAEVGGEVGGCLRRLVVDDEHGVRPAVDGSEDRPGDTHIDGSWRGAIHHDADRVGAGGDRDERRLDCRQPANLHIHET